MSGLTTKMKDKTIRYMKKVWYLLIKTLKLSPSSSLSSLFTGAVVDLVVLMLGTVVTGTPSDYKRIKENQIIYFGDT